MKNRSLQGKSGGLASMLPCGMNFRIIKSNFPSTPLYLLCRRGQAISQYLLESTSFSPPDVGMYGGLIHKVYIVSSEEKKKEFHHETCSI